MKFSYNVKPEDITDYGFKLLLLHEEYHKEGQSELVKTLIENEIKSKYGPGEDVLLAVRENQTQEGLLHNIINLGKGLLSCNVSKRIGEEKVEFVEKCLKQTENTMCDENSKFQNKNVSVSDIRVVGIYDGKGYILSILLQRDVNLGDINKFAEKFMSMDRRYIGKISEIERKFAINWSDFYLKNVIRKQLKETTKNGKTSISFTQTIVKINELSFTIMISLPLQSLDNYEIKCIIGDFYGLNISDYLLENM